MRVRDFFRLLVSLPAAVALAFIVYLPGEGGVLLRRAYYRLRLKSCGENLRIMPGVHITGHKLIEVGDNVTIRENAIINTGAPLVNDQRTLRWVGLPGRVERGVVRIGSHSRIAFGALILGYGGVIIGEKCGIGPGAIVLSETFHHGGGDRGRMYKYSQGALPEEQCVAQGAVELMDGAGLASHTLVLPGALIGRDAWIAPNSVVRPGGRVSDRVIAKGDPAVTVFQRGIGE
jgi:acetyltransferase-like isoleucine patch superfamily enzyme